MRNDEIASFLVDRVHQIMGDSGDVIRVVQTICSLFPDKSVPGDGTNHIAQNESLDELETVISKISMDTSIIIGRVSIPVDLVLNAVRSASRKKRRDNDIELRNKARELYGIK